MELKQLARGGSDPAWISARLTALGRERIAVSAILGNRRIEAAKKVVVFSRWLTGSGVELHGEQKRWRARLRVLSSREWTGAASCRQPTFENSLWQGEMVFNSLHSARAIQPISSSGAQKPRILQGGFADASRK